MYKQEVQKTEMKEVTCSVLFTNPRFNPKEPSFANELDAVTCLVSKTEDLQLDRVFRVASQGVALESEGLNRSLYEFEFEDAKIMPNIKMIAQEEMETMFRYIIETHEKTTVQIDINKMYFNCHLMVLQVYSPFFRYLTAAPLLVSLPEEHVSRNALMLIYKWMLSDEPILDQRYIAEIFVAATYLQIEALLALCWSYFDDGDCYNEDTACVLYGETLCHPALDLIRNLMLSRIQKFFLTFVASRDFLSLPASHVIYLLDSSNISVNTEIEILFVAVRWLGHHWEQRRIYAKRILSCVRYQLLPLWYLLYVRREEQHQLLADLISMPEVNDKISEAISSITSRMYDAKLAAMDISPGKGDTLMLPDYQTQRKWICDRSCNYYHQLGCPSTREIRFEYFENYLLALQDRVLNHWSKVEMVDASQADEFCSLEN